MSVAGFTRVENRVSISLMFETKRERHELRKKLEAELNSVRMLVDKLDRYSRNLTMVRDDEGKLRRVYSEVSLQENRSVDRFSVITPDHTRNERDNNEDKKRYRKENVTPTSRFEMGSSLSKVFKSCSLLLSKLMSHKLGWVFNSPVDVKALGLHDYFSIIKHPMDLGTVKTRLAVNWYKSPKEFAEDVRLTFVNAMSYNPKGHDVYKMAMVLMKIFEDKWFGIEVDYMQQLRASEGYRASLLTPVSREAPIPPLPPAEVTRTSAVGVGPLDRSEPMRKPVGVKPFDRAKSMTEPVGAKAMDRSECMMSPVGAKPKNTSCLPPGKTPAAKKPKAENPHKRDMTYVEKRKLSTDLQNVPPEKLDYVVQIIQKWNPSLCHDNDEIDLDIDSLHVETLWELDRFVRNLKKNLSKINRLPELTEVGGMAEASLLEKDEAPTLLEQSKERKAEEKNAISSPYVQHKQHGVNASRLNI